MANIFSETIIVELAPEDALELLHILRHYGDALPKVLTHPAGEDERIIRIAAAVAKGMGCDNLSPWDDEEMGKLERRVL